jgi:hypothetical protein
LDVPLIIIVFEREPLLCEKKSEWQKTAQNALLQHIRVQLSCTELVIFSDSYLVPQHKKKKEGKRERTSREL